MAFLNSETGAVTVDWVVLTAALVGLGLATMGVVSSGVEDVSGDIDGQVSGTRIFTSFNAANYTPFYDAIMRKNAADNDSQIDFEATVAAFKAFTDEQLVENIQIAEVGYVNAVATYEALEALDTNSVTAAQLASALGGSEAAIQTAIDTGNYASAGELQEFLTAHFNQAARTQEFRKALADERGLTY